MATHPETRPFITAAAGTCLYGCSLESDSAGTNCWGVGGWQEGRGEGGGGDDIVVILPLHRSGFCLWLRTPFSMATNPIIVTCKLCTGKQANGWGGVMEKHTHTRTKMETSYSRGKGWRHRSYTTQPVQMKPQGAETHRELSAPWEGGAIWRKTNMTICFISHLNIVTI